VSENPKPAFKNPLRRLYAWVEGLAERPGASWSLAGLAFAESSFFPIPPDVLLIALGIARPKKVLRFAFITTLCSVLGGLAAYAAGMFLYQDLAVPILRLYGALEKIEHIRELYRQYDAWVVATAGFTPIPYKLFTLGAGACGVNLLVFTLASLAGRGARFYLISLAVWRFGPQIKPFLDKYFDLISIVFMVSLIGGFLLVRTLL
jgi:membrane protein YqaA with SNARE-associated domain